MSVSLVCHLKTGNSHMISFMFKCPIVRISSSYLPAIKSSSQNAVRIVHVPSPMSIPIPYVNPFSSYPFQSALTQANNLPLFLLLFPHSDKSCLLLQDARAKDVALNPSSARETTNSSKIIGIQ